MKEQILAILQESIIKVEGKSAVIHEFQLENIAERIAAITVSREGHEEACAILSEQIPKGAFGEYEGQNKSWLDKSKERIDTLDKLL